MKARKTALAVLAAVLTSASFATSAVARPTKTDSPAAEQPPASCSAEAQASGECIGWTGGKGADPFAAAIASSLRLGNVEVARKFFANHRSKMTTSAESLISQAFAIAAKEGADAAADVLQPLVFPVEGQPATGAVVPRSPQASQIDNGETKATGYYYWVLHGSTTTLIYYGYVDSSGAHTLGAMTSDLEAHTYFEGDGAHIYQYIRRSTGPTNYMSSASVKIYQDVTLGSDPLKSTVSGCTAAGYTLNCNQYSHPSMTTGNWYYFRINWTNNPAGGYPTSKVQVETRRWKVVTASNWQFLAYQNGG